MKNNILNHIELKQRVAHLKSQKTDKEELIKYNAKEIYTSFNPVNILKKALSRIATDNEIKSGVISLVLNKAIGFVSDKIFSNNKHTHHSSSSNKSNNLFTSISSVITNLFNSR
jgi:hypothetical protein